MNRKTNIFEMAKELNELARNAGSIEFKINYNATDGNIAIHEAFLRFCADNSNNERLAGIGKLLEYYSIFELIDNRLSEFENKFKENEKKKEVKTI